jgi:hypothetical protein
LHPGTSGRSPDLFASEVADRAGALELSFAQERIWFLDQLQPGDTAYTIALAMTLRGTLSPPALSRSVDRLVDRHEPLRTTFGSRDGAPFQRVEPPGRRRVAIPLIALGGLPEPARRKALARNLRSEVACPFDLARGPLLRLRLIRLGEWEHVLTLAVHHIIADGWSMGVMVRDLKVLYEAERAGRPSAADLPPLPVQYADYALAQRRWLDEPVGILAQPARRRPTARSPGRRGRR